MSAYSPSQYLGVIVVLIAGVVVALPTIRKAYARSVRRLMRASTSGSALDVPMPAPNRATNASRAVATLAHVASPAVENLLVQASRARSRRTRAIVASLFVVGLLQGLVFLMVIEPGRVRLRGIVVATLGFTTPALLAWLISRMVSQGQPSELGLWAGLALGLLSGAGLWVSIASLGSIRLVTAVVAFLIAVVASYIVLVAFASVLRAAQSVGRLSSDSLAATLSCFAVGAFWAIRPVMDGRPAGWLYLAPALAFPLIFTAIASLVIARGATDQRAPRLLLLRTFGHAKRSNRLLREVSRTWLELGPIELVGGPDLASAVVTLDKVYAWLTGRLRSLFIGDSDDFARASASGTGRFRDGRYRVREFSCLDSAWRDTVTALARGADAIVMDLRNFSRQNGGCIFEIRTLVATVPADRIVFLVDGSTDQPALDEVLQRAANDLRSRAGWTAWLARVYRGDADTPASIRNVIAVTLGTIDEHRAPKLSTANSAKHTTRAG